MDLGAVYVKASERFWRIVDDRATHETNHVVQKYLYALLNRVVASEEGNEDKTTQVMDKQLKRTLTSTERLEPVDSFVDLLMWLAINRENPWALETIEDIFFKDPIQFANSLNHAVSHTVKAYVVPKILEIPEGPERRKRAIAWLEKFINAASRKIKELRTTLKEHGTEETEKQLHDIYGVN